MVVLKIQHYTMPINELTSALLSLLLLAAGLNAAELTATSTNAPLTSPVVKDHTYLLRPTDIVQVNVYQEEDMGARARLEKDGTILLPLVGKVQIGGKNLEEASRTIRELLARDFLVNPQVSVTVVEYAKRRFTVLGQVQRPGSYEMPSEEALTLLQAIAIAGGYTRIGAPSKITVQRTINSETRTYKLDGEAMSKEKNMKPFEIMADDTITVGERLI
jgi:protein involved in polysaccharide export with SLBB domain